MPLPLVQPPFSCELNFISSSEDINVSDIFHSASGFDIEKGMLIKNLFLYLFIVSSYLTYLYLKKFRLSKLLLIVGILYKHCKITLDSCIIYLLWK